MLVVFGQTRRASCWSWRAWRKVATLIRTPSNRIVSDGRRCRTNRHTLTACAPSSSHTCAASSRPCVQRAMSCGHSLTPGTSTRRSWSHDYVSVRTSAALSPQRCQLSCWHCACLGSPCRRLCGSVSQTWSDQGRGKVSISSWGASATIPAAPTPSSKQNWPISGGPCP